MNTKYRIFVVVMVLAISALSCNMDRVLNPALPTFTPSPAVPTSLSDLIPTPTITPVPSPEGRVESGDQALFNGDWDRALFEFQQALNSSNDPEVQAAALLGLGRTYYRSGDYTLALEPLNTAIGTYPDTSHRSALLFALGQVYAALDRYTEAIDAFQQYMALRPALIDFYVLEEIGDLQVAAGNFQGAINTYSQALQSPYVGDPLYLNIKIGDAYVLMGDFSTALVLYEDVFNRSSNDFVKAQMQRYIGHTSIQNGDPDRGYAAYLFAVENYPLSYDSYLALIELVDAGVDVSDLDRGLVDYFAGQYSVAASAFERYLAVNPDAPDDTAHYYNGLSLQAVGAYDAAISEFQTIIDDYLNDTHWADAFDEIAYTEWFYLGDYDAAIATYEAFVDRAPTHPKAPEFLYFAGRVAERNNDLPKAVQLWERLGIGFSTSEYAYEGFFQAGIAHYRLRDYAGAIPQFQSALGLALDSEQQARAYFWIGKSYNVAGAQPEALSAWQQALDSDPTGYYSERARDILEGRQPYQLPASYETNNDLVAERAQAENWLRLVFSMPEDTNFNDLSALQADPRFARGSELWSLGLYNEARIEFESLRQSFINDPANTYRLANYFIDIGLYRSGVIAARQVLELAGYDDAGTFNAPIYFNRLRFGLYYPEIIFPVSDAYDFHPLFLYSVLRQESLFEGFVTSTAGARGLMQIIPATGDLLFAQSGWPPDYTSEDLYRPLVSITYGADYLESQRVGFGNDLYVALAAYNGGPGNAAAWQDLADGDPDLFAEVVRFEETRRYLRSIYELFVIYRNLYGVNP